MVRIECNCSAASSDTIDSHADAPVKRDIDFGLYGFCVFFKKNKINRNSRASFNLLMTTMRRVMN